MAVNYAPILDGSLPAFSGKTLKIPFTMNQAVGDADINGFRLKVKTISTNTELFELDITDKSKWNKTKSILTFSLSTSKKNQLSNTFYKVQLAYLTKKSGSSTDLEESPYSTVGIIKYTSVPTLDIEIEHKNPLSATGKYQTSDSSEKLYSSYFKLQEYRDKDWKTIHTSDQKLHNVTYDSNSGTAIEKFNYAGLLNNGTKYKIIFYITTINGLETSLEKEFTANGISLITTYSIRTAISKEKGYIRVYVKNKNEQERIYSAFVVARASNKDTYQKWDILQLKENIKFESKQEKSVYIDYALEQGVTYKYCIFTVENGEYTKQLISGEAYANFEDMFLSDENHNLRISLNPKVSSLKNVIQEAKLETMGGKYPFFFRNGYVNYKEIPISGLISHLMDADNVFLKKEKYFNYEKTTDLSDNNVYNERLFKLKVLEWLNNGKPKLFKSPAEGTYIVRLMNVSLSPLSDGLSRMLHSFSATAYEFDELTFDNLQKHNLVVEDGMDE